MGESGEAAAHCCWFRTTHPASSCFSLKHTMHIARVSSSVVGLRKTQPPLRASAVSPASTHVSQGWKLSLPNVRSSSKWQGPAIHSVQRNVRFGRVVPCGCEPDRSSAPCRGRVRRRALVEKLVTVRNYFLLTVHFVTPLASLPWPRRASRVVARGSRVLGGVVGPSRLARRAFSIESGRSPNQPATA